MDIYEFMDLYSGDAELYHHGIKGQKWGVRNGPPYPIGSGKDPKVFLEKYKNTRVGSLKEKWNRQTFDEKCRTVIYGATALSAVSTVIQIGANLYRRHKADKLEEKREKRLQEREKRLQEQYKNKKEKSQKAGAIEKELKDMTNAEVEKEIRRMQLERMYNAEVQERNKLKTNKNDAFKQKIAEDLTQKVILSTANMLLNKYLPQVSELLPNIRKKKAAGFREIRSQEQKNMEKEYLETNFDPDARINRNNRNDNNTNSDTFDPDARIKR